MAAPEADWEASKENFQPLKTGRKAAALRDSTAELRTAAIEERRKAFWEELAAYAGDDPLEVWLRFIKWTQETFSAGGHKAELLPLLERCTRELQANGRYVNDIRYLRVWIQYADCLPDPGDVFAFLCENGIGQEHALFYVAHATYLEARGGYAKADAVYQQGINVLAAPVERLRAKYAEFQQRMARRIQRKAAEQGVGEAPEPEHPERQSLGVLGGRRPGAAAGGAGRAGGLLGGAAGFKRKAAADPENGNAGGSGLDIFVDDEFAGAGPAASAPAAFLQPGRSAAAAGAWSKLTGFEAGRKENVQRASMWAGQRIKQAPAHSAPAAAPLEVFVDPELQELEEQQAAAAAAAEAEAASKPSLRQRLDAGGAGEEAILQNPLQLHKAQAQGPVLGGVAPSGASLPLGVLQPEAKRRREEVMAFDQAALIGGGGEELCFEEAEAASPPADIEAKDELADAEPAKAQPAVTQPSAAPASGMQFEAAGGVSEPTITLSTRDAFAAINQMFGGALPPDAHPADLLAGGGAAAAAMDPTMTIATKDAFAALNQMFKGSLPLEHGSLPPNPYAEPTLSFGRGGVLGGSGSSSLPIMVGGSGASGSGGYEPTMTISTKAAFDAINQMFKGSLPGEHGGALPPTARGPAYADPTVTISTKAAFEAINAMFGGGSGGGSLPAAPSQPAAQQHGGSDADGFRVPAPRPPRARPAAPAAAPAASPGGFCIHEDTQYVSVPLEPAADSPAGSGGGFCIREDTQFITVPAGGADEDEDEEAAPMAGAAADGHAAAAGPARSPGGFCIREDTQFITVAVDPEEELDEKQQLQDEPAAAQPAAAPAAAPAPAFGGFSIREDTQFIGLGGGASPTPSPEPAAALGGSGGSGRLLPQKRPLGARDGSTGDLLGDHTGGSSSRLDDDASPTLSGGAVQLNKWGFAPGADDTLAINLGGEDTLALLEAADLAVGGGSAGSSVLAGSPTDSGMAAGVAGEGSSALRDGMAALRLSDCKENLVADGCAAVTSRQLRDPGAEAAALQLLGSSRAALVGAAVEADAAAEAALGGGLPGQDSFGVYADSDGCSMPLLGSPTSRAVSPEAPAEEEAGFVTPLQQAAALGGEGAPLLADPFSPGFHPRMLACLEPSVAEWPGVYTLSLEEETAADDGFKAAGRASAGLVELQLCGLEFAVSGCIGEGAYARVYQGVDGDCSDVALKHEAPPCPWEWYICKALAGRLPADPAVRQRFADPAALLLGQRSSVLVAPLGPHGSLQDLLNAYLAQRQAPPPECVVMHFAAELLRTMQHLHAARILHADIKPDNLLVRLDADAAGDENAGPALGLQLIDFGRGVDLELLPAGAMLQGDSGTDAFRCVEMREGRPWLWQADAYGAAATLHTLLFGQYMEVERVRDSNTGEVSLRPRQPFKRHWARELWGALFHRLLNHTDPLAPPALDYLIASLEEHMRSSRDAARSLRKELAAAAQLLPRLC
ncbi:mitotic checkpoint serine threonine- kinase BUB1 [Chlorella sorokiniana]|uniref:Mitotic checkpoint serine threonine-kinase BUB1 n=1 Tax=Chlorella sorokiniana TaxID=3076 RepID=A0A2P6TB66_CHLSO|nr:mitotic checkpoint serine threonine- kinase BUB1 [Chlorella sorokiniana]|eukprot:PRW05791.1 mitotic checkpoint serine threonine- kinase BUB1 [Chlorella sorokiniana]